MSLFFLTQARQRSQEYYDQSDINNHSEIVDIPDANPQFLLEPILSKTFEEDQVHNYLKIRILCTIKRKCFPQNRIVSDQ